MSSVSAAPALLPPAFKRAATLTVYRWELRKLVSQKRTYLGLGLAMILPLIFVIVQSVRHHHDRGENIFVSQITQSGLATPVLMLLFLSVFMLPLIASLVAGSLSGFGSWIQNPLLPPELRIPVMIPGTLLTVVPSSGESQLSLVLHPGQGTALLVPLRFDQSISPSRPSTALPNCQLYPAVPPTCLHLNVSSRYWTSSPFG